MQKFALLTSAVALATAMPEMSKTTFNEIAAFATPDNMAETGGATGQARPRSSGLGGWQHRRLLRHSPGRSGFLGHH